MSVEETEVIDIISFDKSNGPVQLTIFDHLEWEEKEGEHLLLLQDKINAYLRFIEGGEVVKNYPKAKGRKIVIEVLGKYPLSQEAKKFYRLCSEIVEKAGFKLEFRLHED